MKLNTVNLISGIGSHGVCLTLLALCAALTPALALATETDRITVEDGSGNVKFRVTTDGNVMGTSFTSTPTDGATVTIQQGPTEAANTVKLSVKDNTNTIKTVFTADGRVGIGTASPTGTSLHVLANGVATLNDVLGINQVAGMGFDIATSSGTPPSGATQGANAAFLIQNTNNGSGISNNFNSFRYIAQVNSPENFTGTITAFNLQGNHNGTGTLTKLQGAIGSVIIKNSGNVTNAYALAAGSPSATGSGTFGNAVGLYINKQKQVFTTNAYGIYQADTGDTNYFAGNVGVGTLDATQKMEVNGGIRINTPATTTKPGCDNTTRGTFWFTQGATGVKDAVEVCAKDSANAYLWRSIY